MGWQLTLQIMVISFWLTVCGSVLIDKWWKGKRN